MKRILLVVFAVCLAVCMGLGIGVVATLQYTRNQAQAYNSAAAAAIGRADLETRSVRTAIDAVPTHFTNTAYFVNTITPEDEAAPLIAALDDARTSVSDARASLAGYSDSPAVISYLRGLEYLDAACESYSAYTWTGVKAGQQFFESSTGQRETGSGESGYGSTQDSLREYLRADPDRLDAVYAIRCADAALAEARKLAERSAK